MQHSDNVKDVNTAKPSLKLIKTLLSDLPQLCCVVKDELSLQVNFDKLHHLLTYLLAC